MVDMKSEPPRSKLLRSLLLVMVGVIAVRLFFIQIIEHDKYVRLAEEQQMMQNTIIAKRGEIYMLDGDEPVEVAMNKQVWTVIIDPMMAEEEEVKKVVEAQAGAQRVAEWDEVFADKSRRYFVVARGVERAAASAIKEAGLSGVWLQPTTQRVYPEGQMASGVLGFVNADGEGQYGVEGSLNKELKGENGILKTVKDVNNIPLTIGDDNVRVPAVDGTNVVLTIDRKVQRKVEQALAAGLERSGVKYASAVVMDPNTGKIWAMANLPTYDPAKYNEVTDAAVFQNDALADAYEPASVCKTFSFSAAIDTGVMTPQTTYYNNDVTVVDGWEIWNASKGKALGTISMQTALSWSLNTGSTQALRLLGGSQSEITEQGKQRLYEYYYNRFGLGQATGIELIESDGLIIPPDDLLGTDARYANMTFGQGINLTSMQVLAAFASVVNGGKYYTPTIVAGEMKNGEFVKKQPATAVRQTVSAETSATMREMLHEARLLYGDVTAKDEGYYVGGKTGTSQALRDKDGDGVAEYIMEETKATYVGYGMTKSDAVPEYVVMVKVWEEGHAVDGGTDAKPIFDDISQYMTDYLRMRKE